MVKGSDLFVAALENEDVDRIFGNPGEENLDMVELIRKSCIKSGLRETIERGSPTLSSRQCARDNGGGPSLGHDGGDALSGPSGHGCLR